MLKSGKDQRRNSDSSKKPTRLGSLKMPGEADANVLAAVPAEEAGTLREGKDIEVATLQAEKTGGAEAVEQVIAINRITKVTKGGKKLSFSALVVVGDTKGRVGYSLSKAAEVSIAIRKAIAVAKKNMVQMTMGIDKHIAPLL